MIITTVHVKFNYLCTPLLEAYLTLNSSALTYTLRLLEEAEHVTVNRDVLPTAKRCHSSSAFLYRHRFQVHNLIAVVTRGAFICLV